MATISRHEDVKNNNNNNHEYNKNSRIAAMIIMLPSVLVLGRVCRPLAVALKGHQGLDEERQPVELDPNDPKAPEGYDSILEGEYYGKWRIGFRKK